MKKHDSKEILKKGNSIVKEFKQFISRGNVMDMAVQNVIDFLIVAACIFFMIKIINRITKKEEKKEEVIPKKDEQVVLLEEIRDLLKKQNKTK